jgi:hypothetical protein
MLRISGLTNEKEIFKGDELWIMACGLWWIGVTAVKVIEVATKVFDEVMRRKVGESDCDEGLADQNMRWRERR